jgi:hypothetical protein
MGEMRNAHVLVGKPQEKRRYHLGDVRKHNI